MPISIEAAYKVHRAKNAAFRCLKYAVIPKSGKAVRLLNPRTERLPLASKPLKITKYPSLYRRPYIHYTLRAINLLHTAY